jgi:major membrane immunogen (membrane-anchored lipoprotein)
MKQKGLLFLLALLLIISSACRRNENRLYDGYYMAEAEDFDDRGWKEYVSIFINNNKIVTVEYNSKNVAGFIKSWDMNYMRTMNRVDGTYPNEYTRHYINALLRTQDPNKIDALTGATNSFKTFRLLATAALARARTGEKSVYFVNADNLEER